MLERIRLFIAYLRLFPKWGRPFVAIGSVIPGPQYLVIHADRLIAKDIDAASAAAADVFVRPLVMQYDRSSPGGFWALFPAPSSEAPLPASVFAMPSNRPRAGLEPTP